MRSMYAVPIIGFILVLGVVAFIFGGGIYTLAAVAALVICGLIISPVLLAGWRSLQEYTAENEKFDEEHDID